MDSPHGFGARELKYHKGSIDFHLSEVHASRRLGCHTLPPHDYRTVGATQDQTDAHNLAAGVRIADLLPVGCKSMGRSLSPRPVFGVV